MISYLIGAIPFGFLISHAKGVDIRTVGSGNIGATNVFRALGKKWGLLTFFCDVSKGFIAAFFIPMLSTMFVAADNNEILAVTCACCAVIGHNWPVYLRFKGGKGIATSAGALLGIAPIAMLIGLASWAAIFAMTRYVSFASILAAIVIACAAWFLYYPDELVLPMALTALAILGVWRHRDNIKRLLRGTENRIDRRREDQE